MMSRELEKSKKVPWKKTMSSRASAYFIATSNGG